MISKRLEILKNLCQFIIIIVFFFLLDYGYSVYKDSKYDEQKQWYFSERFIDVENAWKIKNSTDNKVVVAVIDTGVDYNHEILKSHIWKNKMEIAENGIDDDNNGYVDDIVGWNFVDNTNEVLTGSEYYENDHGTEIASIISAGSAWTKFKGINYSDNVEIMSLKVLSGIEKEGTVEDLIQAIKYAEENGAQICNLSVNFNMESYELQEYVKSSKMLFVVSAGNDKQNLDEKPVYLATYNYANLISVAATSRTGELSKISNYGLNSVDIAAPGENIYCAVVNGYDYDTGTSIATAMVTGTAAMIMSCHDIKSSSEIKDIILQNVDKNENLKDKVISGGALNTLKSIIKEKGNKK